MSLNVPPWYLQSCKLGLTATSVRWMGMSDDASRFRDRATDCRNLAKSARNSVDAAMLEDIAADLDEEADKIDAQNAAKPKDDEATA